MNDELIRRARSKYAEAIRVRNPYVFNEIAIEVAPALFRAVDELGELRDILRSYGFVPCDIPACNCGRWHPRYGLKERWDEICALLDAAGHPLSNENGHIALRALQSFVDERDELRKRVAELESHKTNMDLKIRAARNGYFKSNPPCTWRAAMFNALLDANGTLHIPDSEREERERGGDHETGGL